MDRTLLQELITGSFQTSKQCLPVSHSTAPLIVVVLPDVDIFQQDLQYTPYLKVIPVNIPVNTPVNFLCHIYKSVVHLIVEYTCTVWSQCLSCCIKVQCQEADSDLKLLITFLLSSSYKEIQSTS